MNGVLRSSRYRGFARDHLETVVIDLTNPSSLLPDRLVYREGLVTTHEIGNFPTALLLDSEGTEVGRVEGYDRRGPNSYVERLEKIVNGR